MNDILDKAVDRFFDHYKGVMNNFPIDGQRGVSRYHETHCRHSHVLNKLKNFTEKTKKFDSSDEEYIKKLLLESLDLADRKVEITKDIFDMVEKNLHEVEMNFKEVEIAKLNLINSNKKKSKPMPNHKDNGSDSVDVPNINNSNKRPKRNVTQTSTTLNKSEEINSNFGKNSSTSQNKKIKTLNKNSKAQSRKNKNVVSELESSDSDTNIQPTYCICEEISYGDMVGCDNDLCPIEWFHFGCVSIVRKPKGKWYCPMCRGTNSKTMKPKPLFMKELEKYNKCKEENWDRVQPI